MKRKHLIAIGATVILAIALVTRALVFLHPTPGDGKNKIRVRFQTIDHIGKGTRVTFAGKPVGEVELISLLSEAFDRRTLSSKPIYPYEITLALDSSVKVYKCDTVIIKTAGLMGERSIAITPQTADLISDLTPLTFEDIIFANEPGSVEETFAEINSVTYKAEKTLDSLHSLVKQSETDLKTTLQSISKSFSELDHLLTSLNNSHFSKKMTTVEDKTLLCLDHFNQLLSDINEYGVLFHQNRNWQREKYRLKSFPTDEEKLDQKMQNVEKKFLALKEALLEIEQEPKEMKKRFAKKLSDLQSEVQGLNIGESPKEP